MPIYDDLDHQGSYEDFLERCHRDFVTTGNPLYAWQAWGMVRATWRRRRRVPPKRLPVGGDMNR
jgi:hypothetical protein